MHDFAIERCDAYALGTLDAEERMLIDAHLALCPECSRAVGDAERVVSAMAEMITPLLEPPPRLEARVERIASEPAISGLKRLSTRWGALAAALILSLGISTTYLWQENLSMRQMTLRTDSALATIAASHFQHMSLTPRSPDVPRSKVLYALDRSWIYLVVDASPCDCRVLVQYGSQTRDLGAPSPNDLISTLFIKNSGRPTAVRLVSPSGAVLAEGKL